MQLHLKSFARSLVSEGGMMTPLLLVAAVASVHFATGWARSATTNIVTSVRNTGDHTVTLEKSPIGEPELAHSAQGLAKLAPAVKVAVTSKEVVISIQSPERFAEFMYALTALESIAADVVWEPQELCLNACGGADVARARVAGFTQTLRQVSKKPHSDTESS